MSIADSKYLNIRSSKKMSALFFWNFKSTFHWRWLEFRDFKEYSYGDDAKHIDWGVSSREWNTIVRRYTEEKQWVILCVNDVCTELWHDSNIKKQLAKELITLLWKSAINSWESFGGIIPHAKTQVYIAPSKSMQVIHQCSSAVSYKKNEATTNFDFLLEKHFKGSVVFILSDNINPDMSSLKKASMKHDVIYVYLASYFENTLSWSGLVHLRNESHGIYIDLDNQEQKNVYILERLRQLDTLKKSLQKIWIDSVFIDEKSSLFVEFIKLMKQREWK